MCGLNLSTETTTSTTEDTETDKTSVEATEEETVAEVTEEETAATEEETAATEEENHPPEITGNIIVENLAGDGTPAGGPYKRGQIHYRVRVDVSDPDGDSLTYEWQGGGPYGYTDLNANPTEWITPDTGGTFYLYVKVKDGRGGETDAGLNVNMASAENHPLKF